MAALFLNHFNFFVKENILYLQRQLIINKIQIRNRYKVIYTYIIN